MRSAAVVILLSLGTACFSNSVKAADANGISRGTFQAKRSIEASTISKGEVVLFASVADRQIPDLGFRFNQVRSSDARDAVGLRSNSISNAAADFGSENPANPAASETTQRLGIFGSAIRADAALESARQPAGGLGSMSTALGLTGGSASSRSFNQAQRADLKSANVSAAGSGLLNTILTTSENVPGMFVDPEPAFLLVMGSALIFAATFCRRRFVSRKID